MATFSDDFNRADANDLGAAWTTTGTCTIESNQAKLTYGSRAYPTDYLETGEQDITVVLRATYPTVPPISFWLKATSDFQSGYKVILTYNAPGAQVLIQKYTGGSSGNVDNQYWNQSFSTSITYRVYTDAGYLKVSINGDAVVSYLMDAYSGNGYYAVEGGNAQSYIDSYNSQYTPAAALTVTPDPIPNFGSDTVLTFTGENTTWTPGQPGSPTLECDHGTLSNQVVASATSATAVYSPGQYLGTVRFTDPDSGAYYDAVVSSDASQFPGGGTQLSTAVVSWLEAQAAQGGLVLADSMENTEAGATFDLKTMVFDLHLGAYKNTQDINNLASTAKMLYILYGALSGYTPGGPIFTQPSTSTSVKEDTEFGVARWISDGPEPWTVQGLAEALAGDPFTSNYNIIEALNALTVETDLQPVLDAIAAAQGDPLATIKAVLDLVYLLDPTGTHNLGEVLTAISNVRGTGAPDLAAVMAKLGQVQPSTAVTLSSLNTQGVDLKTLLDTLALVIGIVAPEAGTVAELISLIYDAVTAAPAPVANAGPPVWIDEEHATIDSPIALSDGLLLEGPMDGVIVSITGARAGAGKFAFGDVTSWRYCGAVIFGSDRGDWEWAQPIGLESQIVTCKTMQHASSALFRLESGFTGTAQPFTVTAGT